MGPGEDMMKQKEKEREAKMKIRQWGEMPSLHFGSISDEMVKTHEIPKKCSIPMDMHKKTNKRHYVTIFLIY